MSNTLEKLQDYYKGRKIEFIAEGFSSEAFLLDDEFIIRVSKESQEIYRREKDILDFLQDKITSVKIPKLTIIKNPINHSIHKSLIGKGWNLNSYKKLTRDQQLAFAKDVARFFNQVHSLDTSVHKEMNIPNKNKSFSLEHINNVLKDEFTESEIKTIFKWFDDIQQQKTDLIFIHQDFKGGNSLVDENHRLTGVFDFCNLCIDDRHVEFHCLYNAEDLSMVKDIADAYEELTGIHIDLDKVRKFKEIGCIYGAEYIANTPGIKEAMPDQWEKYINRIKNLVEL